MASVRQLEGAEEAQKIALLHRSPRYIRLNELERWVDTTQYDGRPDWFDGSETAPPLRARKPCIAYPIVRTAIDSNVDLTLGEGKFPAIQLTDGDDKDAGPEGTALSDDDRKIIDGAIKKLESLARLRPAIRSALALAQACGSVAVIGGVRNGVPTVDVEQAKRCVPTFADDGSVESLEIRYPFIVEVKKPDGSWRAECRLYRRTIDTDRDVTYKPVVAPADGREPTGWAEDPTKTVAHGLGFCPVIWYRHMVACRTEGVIDGRAIHSHLLDEIEALDMALSQWHRGAWFAGDPQIVVTGADERGPMTGETLVRAPDVLLSTPNGGELSDKNPMNGQWGGRAKKAKVKSPGVLWEYESKDAKVEILSLSGDALKAIQDHCSDLRDKVAEGLAIVFTDPSATRFAAAVSGKAQKLLRQRQLDRCDQYRDDMADGLVTPLVQLLLRVIEVVGVKAAAIMRAVPVVKKLGERPSITLRWGAYYEPDPEEETQLAKFVKEVDSVIALPLRVKLQKLARALDIENVDALLAEIEAEQAKRDEKAAKIAESGANALMQAAHGDGTPVGKRAGGPAGAGAQANAGGRGGPPPPAAAARAPGG